MQSAITLHRFRDRGAVASAFRLIPQRIPTVKELNLPPLLDKVLPVHEVVPVDLTLPGCPPHMKAPR